MLKQHFFSLFSRGLIFGLFSISNICAQPFDWYMTQSASGKLDQATAQEILKELQAGDSQNVVVVEYLLKIAKEPLDYNFLLNGVLNDKLQYLYKILYELGGKSSEPLEYIISQTGFSEPVIRQRLLNNVALLERLLAILGQGYDLNIKSSLFDKQEVLKGFGTTNKLLELFLENGYTQDQLVLFIRYSHEQSPSRLERRYGPVANGPSTETYIPREKLATLISSLDSKPSNKDLLSSESLFSAEKYNHYMDIVKSIDALAYDRLKKCEKVLASPCLRRLVRWNDDTVMAPTKDTEGYPILRINEANLDEINEKLEEDIEKYKTLYVGSDVLFSKAEYDSLMNKIKKIDEDTYNTLKECELALGRPCLIKDQGYGGNAYYPNKLTRGYSIMSFNQEYDNDEKLEDLINLHKYLGFKDLTQEDRNHILNVIKSVAPMFYNLLVAVDPTGERHIESSDSTGVNCRNQSDLPIIYIDSKFMSKSFGMQRFIIGHELGHFVLGHVVDDTTRNLKYYKELSPELLHDIGEALENAYSRDYEYAADRFAVVNMGVPISDGIAFMKHSAIQDAMEADVYAEADLDGETMPIDVDDSDNDNDSDDEDYSYEEVAKRPVAPEEATFNRTHPRWGPRIAHLESLAPEVELCRQGRIPCGVDWDKAIASCRAENETLIPMA